MTKTFEFKKTNNRILTTNYRESKKVACLEGSIVKNQLNMNASISASVKAYVFYLIKRNLKWSMQIVCMDGTKGEALIELKLVY